MRKYWSVCSWLFVAFLGLFFLSGCGSPKSAVTRHYRVDQETDTGHNFLIFTNDAKVDGETKVRQDGKPETNTPIDATIPLGGKATAAAEGVGLAKDLLETVEPGNAPPASVPSLPADDDGVTKEEGTWWGRHNGDRPTWYFTKKMSEYPESFRVVIPGCDTVDVINDGHRYCSDGTSDCTNGILAKQSDVSGRGLAVVAPKSCESEVARLE